MDIWISSQFWAITNSAAMNIFVQVFVLHMLLFLLGIYWGVELLEHMITLWLAFWEIARLFSTVAVAFDIPNSSVWGFQFLYILIST